MSSKLSETKPRDAERSKAAILDAAEELFAHKGFEGVSFAEIGQRAGVSRGTPGYFFGSKEELYKAVLERNFSQALEGINQAAEQAAKAQNLRAVIAAGVEGYLDFLAQRPRFIRLIEWESLSGGKLLAQNPVHIHSVMAGVGATAQYLPQSAVGGIDIRQLVISIMALCWFPLSHAQVLLPALGLDPNDPGFLEARKQHIVDLLYNAFLKDQA